MAEPLSKAKLSGLRKLRRKKNRDRENRFLIEGWHLLDEALKAGVRLRTLLYDDSRRLGEGDREILAKAIGQAESLYLATESQLLALGETKTSSGVVGVVDRLPLEWGALESALAAKRNGFVVAMDGVSDPGNCGSIIRGGSWFGVDAALLGEGCPDLENGKLLRATMGGLFHLPVLSVTCLAKALDVLKKENYKVVASVLEGAAGLNSFKWPPKTVLLVGNEARGVSDELLRMADYTIEISKFGQGESLNAAMAASIMLSHWRIG